MKKISTWLIIIGIILLLIPTIGKVYVNYKQDELYKDYLSQIEQQDSTPSLDQPENNNEDNEIPDTVDILDEDFNEAIIETEESTKKDTAKKPKLNAIGSVQIPNLSIDLILLEGSTQTELLYGAGHMSETAYPGEVGNCAIAGHRGYTFGTYFYRLDELKVGDIVTVKYNSNSFNYKVDESLIILPTDVYILAQPKDKKQLTLITCDPPIVGSHRLVIRATLVENEE